MMKKSDSKKYLLGLDLGSTQICATIAAVDHDNQINIQGIGTSVTAGFEKGNIVDEEQYSKSIQRAITRAERESGKPASIAIINLNGKHVINLTSHGLYKSNEPTDQISKDDKLKVLKKAKLLCQKEGYKIVHFLPIQYRVDEKVSTRDPVGVFGKLLEVKALALLAEEKELNNILRIIHGTGLEVGGIVVNAVATSEVLLTKEEKQNGALLIDFGGGYTQVAHFSGGVLQKLDIIPLGAQQITNDLAYCLKVPVPEAERLKVVFGHADAGVIAESEKVEIMTASDEQKEIFRKYLCQIIEARVEEIIKHVKLSIDAMKIDRNRLTFVLSGGGSQLKGLQEYCYKTLHLRARDGIPDEMKSVIESTAYAPSIGLVLYAVKHNILEFIKETPTQSIMKPVMQIQKWVKDLF